MKTGAIHRPAPAHVPLFAARASLNLMVAPATADWFAACPADGDTLGNSAYGDCVPVTDYRIIQVRRANVWGDHWAPTMDLCLARYTALTGFNPITGQPDTGTPTDADMADWCSKGIRIDSQNLDVPHWTVVDPQNVQHVNLAIAHGGPVAITINLPLGAQTLDWSVAPGTGADWVPGSWGAHRVPVGKYDGAERTARTWGRDLIMHPEFWSRYVISCDLAVSREWLTTTGLTPAGMDWDELSADSMKLAA